MQKIVLKAKQKKPENVLNLCFLQCPMKYPNPLKKMQRLSFILIVIFAGYSDKMEEFLGKNPGLRSRIAFHVPFEDYTTSELIEIAELMADKDGLILGEGVREKLLPIMETAVSQADFGNGRFVRNLMERARMKQASRLVHSGRKLVTAEQIATLIQDDFEMPEVSSVRKHENRVIGFNCKM